MGIRHFAGKGEKSSRYLSLGANGLFLKPSNERGGGGIIEGQFLGRFAYCSSVQTATRWEGRYKKRAEGPGPAWVKGLSVRRRSRREVRRRRRPGGVQPSRASQSSCEEFNGKSTGGGQDRGRLSS